MSASSKTPNFDFPLYEPQDTFAPLTSFNLLSSKADQQLALVKSSADTAEALSSANEQDIQVLETWKAGATLLLSKLNSNIISPVKLIWNEVTGVNSATPRATMVGTTLLFQFRGNIDFTSCPSFQRVPGYKMYVFTTSSTKIYRGPLPSNQAAIICPMIAMYKVENNLGLILGNAFTWQDSNLVYFGIEIQNESNILQGHATLIGSGHLWGCYNPNLQTD